MTEPPAASVDVVATAGHVDHGKSSLIARLTGMDPDRLAEEKRRGLTIDLGFAWRVLPSGREVGFVDVPGHERFVRNMLAGVGPVRLVLFVVAADEGWRPQSEEHLQILDVLGVDAGVVALTKRDLVDRDTLEVAREEVRERLEGTVLAEADVVACSSVTGEGLPDLEGALDSMLAAAPRPARDGRARLHVDRVFAISGAGTVVTGTLTGGPLRTGDEVSLLPSGARARVRGLQTHRRRLDEASPISRVAVNLVGADRSEVRRGDVLTHPGRWRPTAVFEAAIRPVRGLSRPLTGRGDFKVYAGAAEREARLRVLGSGRVAAGEAGFARIHAAEPLVLEVGDGFVLRESGRGETVAGGTVLDPSPPRRPGADAEARLRAREAAGPPELARLVVAERGAIEAAELEILIGTRPQTVSGAVAVGGWWLFEPILAAARREATEAASAHHRDRPLEPGAGVETIRRAIAGGLPPRSRGAADAILQTLVQAGALVRDASTVRLPGHRPALEERRPDLDRVLEAVRSAEPTPPTIAELGRAGHARGVIDAAIRSGELVRISPELVLTRDFVDRAVREITGAGDSGLTVSALREALGTSRKYALPLMEHLDQRGITIRRGDVRVARRARG
jgi:selenocysteine-specific elongation factor